MLDHDALTGALHDGVKLAERCSRFCTFGCEVDGDKTFLVWHNSVSSVHTNEQRVYADKTLAFSREAMTGWLRKWITSVHDGRPFDLNVST